MRVVQQTKKRWAWMSGQIKDAVTLVPITEAEASDDLIRQLEADARPDTVQRIARIIESGRRAHLTNEAIAQSICTMIFEGEPIDGA